MGTGNTKRRLRALAEENAQLRRELDKPLDQRLREAQEQLRRIHEDAERYEDDDGEELEPWEDAVIAKLDHIHDDLVAVRGALNIQRPECYPRATSTEGRAERAREE